MTTDFDAVDFFRDRAFVRDPYPYFEHLRAKCPVAREDHHGVFMVTGYDEACQVYADTDTWSSVNSVSGPFPGVPFEPVGDDIGDLIEEHREGMPMSDQLPTFDPPKHRDHRALLMRLLTPARLRANEDQMARIADRQIDTFIGTGRFDAVSDFGAPFTFFVIADLLGVPEADQAHIREEMQGAGHKARGIAVGSTEAGKELGHKPLGYLYETLAAYVEDRRAHPREDVITGIASATFPDGSLPTVDEVTALASNLFGAGQETTVRLIAAGLQLIAEDPELQARLRADRSLIPDFVEECLRMESPVKGHFRLARRTTSLGGVDIPAGSVVMILNGATNRDPGTFACPAEFRLGRENSRQHLAFGRGVHTCPGGPLARAEGRVTFERLLDRTTDIRIDEERHGAPGERRFEHAATFILRGLNHLHLTFR